jgi:hypothetical protein
MIVVGSHIWVSVLVPVGVIVNGVVVGVETVGEEVEISAEALEVSDVKTLEAVAFALPPVTIAVPELNEALEVPVTTALTLVLVMSVPLVAPPVALKVGVAVSEVMTAEPEVVLVGTPVAVPKSLVEEVGTKKEAVPRSLPVTLLVGSAVAVGITEPISLVTLATTLVVLPKALVSEAITDPKSLVEVGSGAGSVLTPKMLEMILARSVVGVDVGASEVAELRTTPVEAADAEGRIPDKMLETILASAELEAAATLDAEIAVDVGSVETTADVVEGAAMLETAEDTPERTELSTVPTEGRRPAAELLETSVAAETAELPDAVPVNEIPDETTAVVVAASASVLDDVTTPPGPNVMALPVEDEAAAVSVLSLVEDAVGDTTMAGADPDDAPDAAAALVDGNGESEAVGETTTAGLDPVDATALSAVVEVVGSRPTIVVLCTTTVVTESSALELAVGCTALEKLFRRSPVVPAEPEELDVSVPVILSTKSDRERRAEDEDDRDVRRSWDEDEDSSEVSVDRDEVVDVEFVIGRFNCLGK